MYRYKYLAATQVGHLCPPSPLLWTIQNSGMLNFSPSHS